MAVGFNGGLDLTSGKFWKPNEYMPGLLFTETDYVFAIKFSWCFHVRFSRDLFRRCLSKSDRKS